MGRLSMKRELETTSLSQVELPFPQRVTLKTKDKRARLA